MINESELTNINNSRDRAIFTISLLTTLMSLKDNENIDDIYMNLNNEKLEVYVFIFKEDFDTEDFISNRISKWEQEQLYFPELFIYEAENKLNVLPRKTFKVC